MYRPLVRLRAALAASLLALAACGDATRDPSPLAPSDAPRLDVTGAAACIKQEAAYLSQQTSALFSDLASRRMAKAHVDAVAAACTSPTAQPYPAATLATTKLTAPYLAIAYAETLLVRRATTGVAATDAVLWNYIARLFNYTGYRVPTSPLGLSDSGFVRICRSHEECPIASPDSQKAVRIVAYALSPLAGVPFLVTGLPDDCAAFSGSTGYTVYGGCLQVSVDPKPGVSFPLHATGTIVELCTRNRPALATPTFIHQRRTDVYTGLITTQGKLAQRSERPGSSYTPVSFRRHTGGLLNDKYCDTPFKPAATGLSALRELGASLLTLFQPAVAHAGHGGLGTLPGLVDEEFSVFGPLDGFAFNGDFGNDVVGASPVSSAEMRAGSWKLDDGTPNPSRASVQYGTGLFGGNYLELNQGGGAAGSKLGLLFNGTLGKPMTTARGDTDRRVRLRFRAALLSPRSFGSLFEARTSGGATLASFVFRDGKSSQSGIVDVIAPAGAVTTALPTWAQGLVQHYQITVTFSADSLGVAKSAKVEIGLAERAPIATYTITSPTPLDLASFGWVLTGRDGQVIGSDDYQLYDVPVGAP